MTEEVPDLDCDYLETCDDYILTRCMDASRIIIWRHYQGHTELDVADEIDISDMKEQLGTIYQFKMQGKIETKFSHA